MTAAWVIRSGRFGERDQWALETGVSGGGWREVPDLTTCRTREEVAAVVAATFAGAPEGRIANYAGQLWALRGRIKKGDLLVMPMKTTKKIAIGIVTEEYRYLAEQPDPDCRHVVGVDWKVADLPRTAVKQDLLYTLGSAVSIFQPSKNKAVQRIQHLLEHGSDPGATATVPGPGPKPGPPVDDAPVDEPELNTDYEQAALDQITSRIQEEYVGHELTRLVAAVLTSEGYACLVAPPGPDGGIDIAAGRGPLGLDTPRIVVQVKWGATVGDQVVTQLEGLMNRQRADQALLVAWNGITAPAARSMRDLNLRMRLWEASDVVDAVLRNYDRLPDDIRAQLPLRRIWTLSDPQA